MASKRSKVAPRTEPEEPEEGPEDAAESDGADEEPEAQTDDAEAEEPAEEDAELGAGRRGEEVTQLAPPPMRLFALFLIPLFALLVWALFFK